MSAGCIAYKCVHSLDEMLNPKLFFCHPLLVLIHSFYRHCGSVFISLEVGYNALTPAGSVYLAVETIRVAALIWTKSVYVCNVIIVAVPLWLVNRSVLRQKV